MKSVFWGVMFFIGILLCSITLTYSQPLRERLRDVEERLWYLEKIVKEEIMPNITIPTDWGMFMDENDPTESGDIKVVKGTLLELDDCDALTQWSVHSGAGVTLEVDQVNVKEGTGSLKITIPPSTTGVVKAIKSAGSWDLSSYKYIKFAARQSGGVLGTKQIHFGETAYNEQTTSFSALDFAWKDKSWDISGIGASSRDGVTIVAFTLQNTHTSFPLIIWIDYIFADPGPSQIKAFDGDRIILLYPKLKTGSYASSADASRTITLDRKGTPTYVQVMKLGRVAIIWINGMGTHSNSAAGTDVTDGITGVGDGYFTIGNGLYVNGDGGTYYYMVGWDD